MEQDGTAMISPGSGPLQGPVSPASEPILTINDEIDWGLRLRLFGRRCAAGTVDLFITGCISILFFCVPLVLRTLFEIWQPPAAASLQASTPLITHALQFAAAAAILTQLFFYAALSESSSAQATLGKILFGLRTTDSHGQRQTFSSVIRRLCMKYSLLAILIAFADMSVNFAAEFISTLQFEQYRSIVKILIVVASFTLCLVEEKQQNLYDIFSGRLVVTDDTKSIKQRCRRCVNALSINLTSLGPRHMLRQLKTDRGDPQAIVTISLGCWTYLCTAALAAALVLAATIASAAIEVDKGLKAQAKNDKAEAAQHFQKALKISPNIANLYNMIIVAYDYADQNKQNEACEALVALRGNGQDYLARARARSKQHLYDEAYSDYQTALSGDRGKLDDHDWEAASVELSMLRLEEESAATSARRP